MSSAACHPALTPRVRQALCERLLTARGQTQQEIYACVAAETGLAREIIWCAVKGLDLRGMPRRGRRSGYLDGTSAARVIAARRRVAKGEAISAVRRSLGCSMADARAMIHGEGRFSGLRPTLVELVADELAQGMAQNIGQRRRVAHG
ncbi:hypothetical protein FDP22_12515 [Paroceanicella profunda]|uniref:Helix-turn-helix domain-containing protein n=1 Tax=Paroceanicella profunda TaxID=2579971 RepID=A0A5B8FYR8_9RHOB|nr:hypothetical protein [Paroceanicella profunda]QDL92530.1 hypothetical protein FDP22_12515 [Paroceanicella profunda]